MGPDKREGRTRPAMRKRRGSPWRLPVRSWRRYIDAVRSARFTSLAIALGIAAVVVPASIGATADATGRAPWCGGTQLSVSFSVVPYSVGAGNVSYALRVKNVSATTCAVSGLPGLRLLGMKGKKLPTHVVDADPGVTAVIVTLKPGHSAWAAGRFSPDVPGTGEPQSGPCEATSYHVSVTVPPRGDAVVGPFSPPNPVCEHGTISLSVLGTIKPVV